MNTVDSTSISNNPAKSTGFLQWLRSVMAGLFATPSTSATTASDDINTAPAEQEVYVIAPGGYRIRIPKPDEVSSSVGDLLPSVRKGLSQVPPLPHVVIELMREIQDANSTSATVAEIISSDPGLAASLIRTVNSAAMGLSRNITSISDAVSYLGFGVVKAMVMRLRLGEVLSMRSEQAACDAEDIWAHSLAVSYAAECLASRVANVDRGFVATFGLLHDIGKLAILSKLSEQSDALRSSSSDDTLANEAKVLGVDHAGLGADLAAMWRLPADLIQAIRLHHTFLNAYHPSDPLPIQKALHIVQIANQLAKYCFPHADQMEIDTIPMHAFALLGLELSLDKLLDDRMQTAISRAIFVANSNSQRPAIAPRRFLRPVGPEAAAEAISADVEPRVQIDNDATEAMFSAEIPAFEEGKFADKAMTAARFTALAMPAPVEHCIKAACAHQDDLKIPTQLRSAATMVVRSLVPNLLQLCEADQNIEVSQSLENGTFTLAIRSLCIATWRRMGKALPPLQARRLAEADLANVLNLGWFDRINISSDGATILFIRN